MENLKLENEWYFLPYKPFEKAKVNAHKITKTTHKMELNQVGI